MNRQTTPQGVTPPTRGLDKEEPEIASEDDIAPEDDDPGGEAGRDAGPRQVERE